MVTPEEKLDEHLSAPALAEYFHTRHPSIGKQYATHGQVWNCDANDRIIGLLHLILKELRASRASQDSTDVALKNHQRWLNDAQYGREALINLKWKISKELARIAKLLRCDVDDFPRNTDLEIPWALGYGAKILQHWYCKHGAPESLVRSEIDRVSQQLKRLRTVKSAKDIIKLCGIGKVKRDALLNKNK